MKIEANINGVSLLKAKPFSPSVRIRLDLVSLVLASRCAKETLAGTCDFALEINELYELGLNITELRWLVARRELRFGNVLVKRGHVPACHEHTRNRLGCLSSSKRHPEGPIESAGLLVFQARRH
jgi:hypothetical protein